MWELRFPLCCCSVAVVVVAVFLAVLASLVWCLLSYVRLSSSEILWVMTYAKMDVFDQKFHCLCF